MVGSDDDERVAELRRSLDRAPVELERHGVALLDQYRRLHENRVRLAAVVEDLAEGERAVLDELAQLLRPRSTEAPSPTPHAVRPEPRALALWLLGEFRVFVRGRPVVGGEGSRCTGILRFLAARAPAPVHKEWLAAQFWPDADQHAARRNLHQAVYVTRRLLGRCGGEGELRFVNDHYSLGAPGSVWRDVDELERLVDDGRSALRRGEEATARVAFGRAIVLYAGHYLADHPHDDWAVAPREYYRRLHREAVAWLLAAATDRGEHLAAVQIGSHALELDPCDEDAARHLITAYVGLGEPHLALMTYEALARAIREHHDVEPTRETTALVAPLIGPATSG